jgi:tRNA threonylcarbamoyladenosine biosynthesis protein TsaB
MSRSLLVLAVDGASPVSSVALAHGDELLAARFEPRSAGSHELLALVDTVLARAGVSPGEVQGWVALNGPGSFTGLRIACATVLGAVQATGARATAVSTFEALALAAPPEAGEVLALVDALRGEWFTQRWRRGAGLQAEAVAGPVRSPLAATGLFEGVSLAVGFGVAEAVAAGVADGSLAAPPDLCFEVPQLADNVARAAAAGRWPWDAGLLTRPLYLRPPAVTLPR